MNKTLAICIPTYNRIKGLERLLNSVINEAKRHQLAIYISDDSEGSGLKKVAQSFFYKFLFYKKNYSNKNIISLLKMSKAKFSWVIGDDDLVLPGAISYLLNKIEKGPKLELILVNAISQVSGDKYLDIKKDIYHKNCVHFFRDFHFKTHLSTPIVRTKLTLTNLKKYEKTFHTFQGAIWEYLAKNFEKNKSNNILVLRKPMILFGKEEKSWLSYFLQIKFYDRYVWLDFLPKIYSKEGSLIRRKIFREERSFRELLKVRVSGDLTSSGIDKYFTYFPWLTRLKAKFIVNLPIFIAKKLLNVKFLTK